jgi:phosphoenolpyruvate carboxykinase (ATP)
MPCLPQRYADLLGEKMAAHRSEVYLVNTGWTGGPYGVGQRMDILQTRTILNAALDGLLAEVAFEENTLFHLQVPCVCPGVPSEILNPEHTWSDKAAYRQRAEKLATEFSRHFDKAYGSKNIAEDVRRQCPGKR